MNDFHGLWGLGVIPNYISIPLTVFACVGIINAINLIDGVDGYSSGYSIVSCILFGVMFYELGNIRMVALQLLLHRYCRSSYTMYLANIRRCLLEMPVPCRWVLSSRHSL